jgi:hypothetical protein
MEGMEVPWRAVEERQGFTTKRIDGLEGWRGVI